MIRPGQPRESRAEINECWNLTEYPPICTLLTLLSVQTSSFMWLFCVPTAAGWIVVLAPIRPGENAGCVRHGRVRDDLGHAAGTG